MTCTYVNKNGLYVDRMLTITVGKKSITRDTCKIYPWPENMPIHICGKRGKVKYFTIVGNVDSAEWFINALQADVVHYLSKEMTLYGAISAIEYIRPDREQGFTILFISVDENDKIDTFLSIAGGRISVVYAEDLTEKSAWIVSDPTACMHEVPYDKLKDHTGEWVIELYSRLGSVSQEYDFLSLETGEITTHKCSDQTIKDVNKYLVDRYVRVLKTEEKKDEVTTVVQRNKRKDK